MKKIVVLMLMMVSVISFGAREELVNKNGKYSGGASIGLVATGRIIERIPQSMLVIETVSNKENNGNIVFNHEEIKGNQEIVTSGKFVAKMYREDRYGKMQLVDLDRDVKTEIVSENRNVGGEERVLKSLEGENLGTVSYKLASNKNVKGKYEGEIVSKVKTEKDKKGTFIDNTTSLKVIVGDIAKAY